MEVQSVLSADYLDIIYDHRNKNYGGYELRKHYASRIQLAFLIVFLLASSSLLLLRKDQHVAVLHPSSRPVTPTDLSPVPKVQPPVARPGNQAARPAAPVHAVAEKFAAPKIVTDDKVKLQDVMPQRSDMSTETTGNKGETDGSITGAIGGTGFGDGDGAPENSGAPTETAVRYVAQMPEFAGSVNAYLSSHLRYPPAARENGVEGRVTVEFIVNEDGSVTNARIVAGIGGGCDEEALRVVNGMPKWKPGRHNGKPVKVYFMLPISFRLN